MQITITIPERPFAAEPAADVAARIRLYAALGMYQAGRLSIGAATELAGVDRYTFLDYCKRESIVLQTQTPEELEAESTHWSETD